MTIAYKLNFISLSEYGGGEVGGTLGARAGGGEAANKQI
jgi:hypothetical protein